MNKLLIIFSTMYFSNAIGQGCSDAGFCSLVNTIPFSEVSSEKVQSLRLSQSIGRADYTIMAYNTALEYSRKVSDMISLNARINFLAHAGNSVQTGEIGDVYFTGDFKIAPKLNSTIGFKIPLRNGDKIKNGTKLPLDYQPSLGTLDFLFALQTKQGNWGFGIGFQQPLTQNNNQFFTNDFVAVDDFPTTNGFYRNSDAWLRISYFIEAGNFTFIPNLLPIYHLNNDNYIEGGERKFIYGSRGLTLNGDIQIDYKLNTDNTLGFNFAMPLINRDVRPDGLTRKFNATLDFRHSF